MHVILKEKIAKLGGVGDLVRVKESKPISKNKRWRLTKIVEKVK